jgi:hypothetical protein
MELQELMWYIRGQAYFECFVLSNGRKVKRFVQLASNTNKGEDLFLICKPLKCTWAKPDDVIINGLKFMAFLDIDNAIPLKITSEIIIETNEYINIEKTKYTISEDKDKRNVKVQTGKPMKMVEITLPPALLYQQVEAAMVEKILAVPPSKWEELKWVFIAGFVVLGFIAWQFINSGIIH